MQKSYSGVLLNVRRSKPDIVTGLASPPGTLPRVISLEPVQYDVTLD